MFTYLALTIKFVLTIIVRLEWESWIIKTQGEEFSSLINVYKRYLRSSFIR